MENKFEYQGQFSFLSNSLIARDDDVNYFLFFAISGTAKTGYATTPEHAKRIYLAWKEEIEKYEKRFGEIKTELPKDGLKSPIQKSDLKTG